MPVYTTLRKDFRATLIDYNPSYFDLNTIEERLSEFYVSLLKKRAGFIEIPGFNSFDDIEHEEFAVPRDVKRKILNRARRFSAQAAAKVGIDHLKDEDRKRLKSILPSVSMSYIDEASADELASDLHDRFTPVDPEDEDEVWTVPNFDFGTLQFTDPPTSTETDTGTGTGTDTSTDTGTGTETDTQTQTGTGSGGGGDGTQSYEVTTEGGSVPFVATIDDLPLIGTGSKWLPDQCPEPIVFTLPLFGEHELSFHVVCNYAWFLKIFMMVGGAWTALLIISGAGSRN